MFISKLLIISIIIMTIDSNRSKLVDKVILSIMTERNCLQSEGALF